MNRPLDPMAVLYSRQGARKYVCGPERQRFLAAADRMPMRDQSFCHLIALTGCRISEALALTPNHLDVEQICVVFRTLKRRRLVFRTVPVPTTLMAQLRILADGLASDERIWRWSRQTGWRRIKTVMELARIVGVCACPKGLRHGYGIANAEGNVPPGLTQRWMGHADFETTAIYQNALGSEERSFAKRLWRRLQKEG
jgi:integrase/recombinase XerD